MRKFLNSGALAAAFVVTASLMSGLFADGITLPDTGVDVGAYITAAITALGTIVAVAVGGWFAWLLIRKALRWARKAL